MLLPLATVFGLTGYSYIVGTAVSERHAVPPRRQMLPKSCALQSRTTPQVDTHRKGAIAKIGVCALSSDIVRAVIAASAPQHRRELQQFSICSVKSH
jgi:hypothetical protein